MEINIVNLNLGSFEDWRNLAGRFSLKETGHDIQFIEKKDIQEFKNSIYLESDKIWNIFKENHEELIRNQIIYIVSEYTPSLFCFQEYNQQTHQMHVKLLEDSGFKFIGKKDEAIAYNRNYFEQIGLSNETYNALKSPMKGKTSPGLYIDLMHKTTGLVIRVVSHHLQGFNAVKRKNCCTEDREMVILSKNPNERLQHFLKQFESEEDSTSALGDASLEYSLGKVTTNKVKKEPQDLIFQIYQIFKTKKPDLIIYGLDANSTEKFSHLEKKYRLHPKRLQLFNFYGFLNDTKNSNPTILDWNDFTPRKYDYIFCKSLKNNLNIQINDLSIDGINNPELLQQPDKVISDHLPVISCIEISKILDFN